MVKFRVKAFFMHEGERAAAERAAKDDVITDTEWTDGYLMGVVDESEIPGLAQKGLVITPIERVETSGESDESRSPSRSVRGVPESAALMTDEQGAKPLGRSVAGKNAAAKILSVIQNPPQFYVVRLNGPLTEWRRAELQQIGISLLERLSSNKYTARLKGTEVRKLAKQTFVDSIRLYSEDDTLLKSQGVPARPTQGTSRATQASDGPRFTLIHAVRLHRAEDIPVVTKWLKQRLGREPLSGNEDILRVALPQGGDEVTELAKLPEVATVEEILPGRPLDRMARGILRLESNGLTLGLEGEGQLIGIADTGLDDTHPDFQGRIVRVVARGRSRPPGDSSDPEGHGTHVAGCALGDGDKSNGEVRGAAPKAKLFFQSILDSSGGLGGLPSDLKELFNEAYQAGARIHNNSWGAFSK